MGSTFNHEHRLIFLEDCEMFEEEDNEEQYYCFGCRDEIISGPVYVCEQQNCEYALHKTCNEYPPQIPHPLHPDRSLNLLTRPPLIFYICQNCRYLCAGFIYHCSESLFSLDAKCAISLTNDQGQRSEVWDKRPPMDYFRHEHILEFFYGTNLRSCDLCTLDLSGPCYGCVRCSFFLHEPCTQKPQELRHPSHPQHPLTLEKNENRDIFCDVCGRLIWEGCHYYSCDNCKFNLHFHCADFAWFTLKHNCHQHGLLYIPADINHIDLHCHACNGSCGETAFYRCVECNLNLHLGCIPVPHKVENECHSHPLILMDSLVEDDSVCDVCEKERSPRHHVYYCEECSYIAHIHCVISEKEASPQTTDLVIG